MEAWIVVEPSGKTDTQYEFGDPLFRKVFCNSRWEANMRARRLAERAEELTCGDINRWEFSDIPMAEVHRRGYRTKKVRVQ